MTGAAMAAQACEEHLVPLSPISDVRGTAEYRNEAVMELIRRALATVAQEEAQG
jgi:CO/xanthine dehydrogenase FAD-binding subunit